MVSCRHPALRETIKVLRTAVLVLCLALAKAAYDDPDHLIVTGDDYLR